MIRIPNIIRAAAVALQVLVAGSLVAQDSAVEVGAKAPVLSLAGTDGKVVNLADVIGKKPVVLEFWAFWCENCKELEPRMFAAHAKHGQQVAFFAVAVAINQSLARVQRHVLDHKYPFAMLWDKDGAAAAAYDVPATSYVVVIDKKGTIVYTGAGGKQDLDAAIKKAL